jgi:hypothetical protein
MFIFIRPDLYIPFAMAGKFPTNPKKSFFVDRDDRQLVVRARLNRGTTLRKARNEIAVLARNFEREYRRRTSSAAPRFTPGSRCGRLTERRTGSSA